MYRLCWVTQYVDLSLILGLSAYYCSLSASMHVSVCLCACLPCSDGHNSPEIGILYLSLPTLTGLMIVAQSPAISHLSMATILGREVAS